MILESKQIDPVNTQFFISGRDPDVINCTTCEVRPIDAEQEYLALSYMWMGSTREVAILIKYRALPFTGQFILDAIEVVTRLGKQHLWADQYCVEQQNADVKDIR